MSKVENIESQSFNFNLGALDYILNKEFTPCLIIE